MKSTPGRMMLAELLPRSPAIPFELINRQLRKQEISHIIDEVYRHCGQKETVLFCDAAMALGFREACKAGISFGKDDMVVPATKEKLIEETRHRVREFEQQFLEGLTTDREKYNLVVDAWSKCTDQVAAEMMKEISQPRVDPKPGRTKELNSIFMMASSGARGSPAADEAAGRHARADGEAVGRNHRDPDPFQLQGRADGARIFQLDPWRAQRPGRHRVEDGEFGLSHPASGRRGE